MELAKGRVEELTDPIKGYPLYNVASIAFTGVFLLGSLGSFYKGNIHVYYLFKNNRNCNINKYYILNANYYNQ